MAVAFQLTFLDAPYPITPDQVLIIIDTGARVTINPDPMNFTSDIHPVQDAEIKGIAAGLPIAGIGDITYTFYNDDSEIQTLLLHN
jgi:hypothetical protein